MKKILFGLLLVLCLMGNAFAMQIKTGTYTGDGNDNRDISGAGFQPEAVIIVNSGYNSCFWFSSMPSGQSTGWNGSNNTNMIQSVSSDGFQVGTDNRVNASGTRYDWIAFDDDGAADIYVGSYSGNGSDNRNYTDASMGFTPDWVMISNMSDGIMQRTSVQAGDNSFIASTLNTNVIQDLIPNGFQLGSSNYVNHVSGTYYYIALKAVANLLVVEGYTGNGADNRNITSPGFSPDYVIIKNEPQYYFIGKSYSTDGTDVADFFQGTTLSNAIQDIISTGFQLGNVVYANENSVAHFFIAMQDGSSTSGGTGTELTSEAIIW